MDKLLTLIDLSKNKHKLLKKLLTLEYNNGVETEEYIETLKYYKLVCEFYNKKIYSLSDAEKIKLLESMSQLNPNLFKMKSFETLLNSNSINRIILDRIKLDLSNKSIIGMYDNNDKNVPQLFSLLGINISNNNENINQNVVNDCMNQDFFNLLYLVIDNKCKVEKDEKFKRQLYDLKEKLLTISETLEERVILTNFSVPNTVKLVPQISLETAGIFINEYIDNLDGFLIDYIQSIISKTVDNEEKRNFYLDCLIMETLSLLLNDKEFIKILEIELEEELNSECITESIREKLEKFNKILDQGITNKLNKTKNRKYYKI